MFSHLKHNACCCYSYFLHLCSGRIFGHTYSYTHNPVILPDLRSLHLPSIFFIIIPGFFLFLPSFPPTQPNHPLKAWVLLFGSFSKLALSPISLQKYFCMPYSSLETTCSPQFYNHSPNSTYPCRGLDRFLLFYISFHNKIFLWKGQPRIPKWIFREPVQ